VAATAALLPQLPPHVVRLRMLESLLTTLHALTHALLRVGAAEQLQQLCSFCTAVGAPLFLAIAQDAEQLPNAALPPADPAAAKDDAARLAQRVFAFVGAASQHAAGRFEDALAEYSVSAAAAAELPAHSQAHALFCMQESAQCYASLSDWHGVTRVVQSEGCRGHVRLTPAVSLRCQLEGKLSWASLSVALGDFGSGEESVRAQLADVTATFAAPDLWPASTGVILTQLRTTTMCTRSHTTCAHRCGYRKRHCAAGGDNRGRTHTRTAHAADPPAPRRPSRSRAAADAARRRCGAGGVAA